jgi:hypothetical protein
MPVDFQRAARRCIPEDRIENFKDKSRLKAEQVKFLRPIAVYALRYHTRNDAVRDRLGVADIVGVNEKYKRK